MPGLSALRRCRLGRKGQGTACTVPPYNFRTAQFEAVRKSEVLWAVGRCDDWIRICAIKPGSLLQQGALPVCQFTVVWVYLVGKLVSGCAQLRLQISSKHSTLLGARTQVEPTICSAGGQKNVTALELPSIYHPHAIGLVFALGLICAIFGYHVRTWLPSPCWAWLVSMVPFLAGAFFTFLINRYYLRKFEAKRRNPAECDIYSA